MSSFIQHEGHAGTDMGDTLVASRPRDHRAGPWETYIGRQAHASATDAEAFESVIQLRAAQKSAYRDLLMAAAMGISTATIATTMGLTSVWSASSFVCGSSVAYSIAAHRILAMPRFVRI